MEGTAEEVASRARRCWLFLLLAGTLAGETRGAPVREHYLVIEYPAGLVIYDRYQRSLADRELASLGPFVPMHILTAQTLLGDGLTSCMMVECGGAPLYLLLESNGQLAGASKAGRISRYDDAVPLHDTVTVLRNRVLTLDPSGDHQSIPLRSGESLTRYFRRGNRTYVFRHADPRTYGWVMLEQRSQDKDWRVEVPAVKALSGMTVAIRDSISSRITEANRVFETLYEFFDRASREQREPPRWTMISYGDQITCSLERVQDPNAFAETTRALARECESFVLGTGLEVSSTPGKIVIGPK